MNLPRWTIITAVFLIQLCLSFPAMAQPQQTQTASSQIAIIYLKDGSIVQGNIVKDSTDHFMEVSLMNGDLRILPYSKIGQISYQAVSAPPTYPDSDSLQLKSHATVESGADTGNYYKDNLRKLAASCRGFSFSLIAANGFAEGYNLGLGVRFMNIGSDRLLCGATVINYFGMSQQIGEGSVTGALHVITFGGDIGYAFYTSSCVFCPYIEPGCASFLVRFSDPSSSVGGTVSWLCFSPGLLIQLPFYSGLFKMGVDARYIFLTGPEHSVAPNAFSLMVLLGF
jgi:hypothetical protein